MDIPRNWRLQHQRYRLQGTRCTACGDHSFPPRLVCNECRSRSLEPVFYSGRGTVYTYTTVYQPAKPFEPYVPYLVAMIDLEEGPRVTAQLTDVDIKSVEIGMPVEMVIRKISEEGERGLVNYGYKFRPPLD